MLVDVGCSRIICNEDPGGDQRGTARATQATRDENAGSAVATPAEDKGGKHEQSSGCLLR